MNTVLFLCTANYYRSRFAEILFNYVAADRNLKWVAESRGLAWNNPEQNVGPISPFARQGLSSRGIRLGDGNRWPQRVTERDLRAADLIIALKDQEHRPLVEASFPRWVDRVEYWKIDDIDCAEPEEALAALEQQLSQLVTRLSRQEPRSIPA
jgi:protein-tyrosine phosphatase